MFTQLHRFADAAFSNDHEFFYITTPENTYTYQIIEAALYDSRHISTLLDEHNESSLQDYFDGFAVSRPDAVLRNWHRTELNAASDKMVQLSTCTVPATGYARFVVTGVLCDERQLQNRELRREL